RPLVEDRDYRLEYSDNINVGQATIRIVFINDYAGSVDIGFEITRAELIVKASDQTKVYNYPNPTPTPGYTITGFVNNENESVIENRTFSVSHTATQTSNIGDHVITITGTADAQNYSFVLVNGTLSITPLKIMIPIFVTPDFTYVSGIERELSVTYDPAWSTVTGNKATYAGNYRAYVNLTNENTTWADGTTEAKSFEWTIKQAWDDIEVDANTLDVLYDGASHTIIVNHTDPVDKIEYMYEGGSGYSTTSPSFENAGTYTIWYQVTRGSETQGGSAQLVIRKADLIVTAEDKTKLFGDADPALTYATPLTWAGTPGTLTGSLQRTQGADVGTYDIIQGTLDVSSNYVIVFTGATFTITEKGLGEADVTNGDLVIGSINPYIYTGWQRTPAPTVTYKGTELINGTDFYYSYEDNIKAGTATVKMTFIGNYSGGPVQKQFTINKATLTVTPDSGQGKQFGDADPALTYAASGWRGPDIALNPSMTGALGRDPGNTPGPYVIIAGNLDVTGGNYTVSVVTGVVFTISSKELDDKDIADGDLAIGSVGSFTYSGSPRTPTPSVTYKGTVLSGADFDYVYANNTNAGKATVTISFKGNYSGHVDINFEIAKAVLTVRANDETVVYGTSNPTPSYTIVASGFVNNENESALTDTGFILEIIESRTTFDVGTHVITISQGTASAQNYSFDLMNGTLTVTPLKIAPPQPPSVTSFVFNGSPHTLDITYDSTWSRIVGGTATNVGSYTAFARLNDNINTTWSDDTIADIPFAWQITAANMNVNANSITRTYDGSPHTITVEGVVSGGAVTYSLQENGTYTATHPAVVNAGTYTVWFKVERTGYVTGGGNAQITIEKAPLSVTANARTKVFGGDEPALTYSVGTWAGDIPGTLTGTLRRESGESVRTYNITQGGLEVNGNNHVIVFTGATFTITERSIGDNDVINGNLVIWAIPRQQWTGSEIRPTTTVIYRGTTLVAGTDFDYGYANNIHLGKAAEVIITFKGNYSGAVKVYFEIYTDEVLLTGTVTYTEGVNKVPIGGVMIHYEIYHGRISYEPRSTTITGTDGKFVISAPTGSTVTVIDVTHNDYLYTGSALNIVMNGAQTADIDMHPCFTVRLGTIDAQKGEILWSTGTGSGTLTSGGIKFVTGTTVYLEAAGKGNYEFSYWTGGIGGNINPTSVTTTSVIGAVFYDSTSSSLYFTLDLGSIDPSEGKIVWSVGNGIKAELTSTGATFPRGTTVVVEAVGVGNYKLSYWTGSLGGNANPERITSNARIGAVFYDSGDDTKYFSLDLGSAAGGRIMWFVDGGIPAELTSAGAKFPVGTFVHLEAVANRWYTFMYWEDDPEGQIDPERVLVMDQNHRMSAVFDRADDMGWVIPALILLTGLIALALLLMARVRHNVKGAVTCDGKGLEGVTIEYAVRDRPATVTTDSDGNYRIRASAGSVITIMSVAKNGYTATGKLPIQFSAENKEHADIAMKETGTREGDAVRGG
ncbi:MAG: hypothetical protein LBE47_03455, partial [Methanomassiliicoccaceae archaeon]|nr:hypothetical protein [Methanomassiliicoccaceae archaeon]